MIGCHGIFKIEHRAKEDKLPKRMKPCGDGLVSASHAVGHGFMPRLRRDGLVSASHAVDRGFESWPGHM